MNARKTPVNVNIINFDFLDKIENREKAAKGTANEPLVPEIIMP
ncbi:hypothetical protein MASR1M46_08000 [Bacteroidales bacterium]